MRRTEDKRRLTSCRERGDITVTPPRLTKQSKNGRLWSIQFFLSFYIFLIPHRGAGRCFIFSYSLSFYHLPPHLFLHLPGVQFPLSMSERTEKEGRSFALIFVLSFLLSSLLFFPPFHQTISYLSVPPCHFISNCFHQFIIPHHIPFSVC